MTDWERLLLHRVDFACRLLAERAQSAGLHRLVKPMNTLGFRLGRISDVLRALHIDTFDLWIAYFMLAHRETSPTGRGVTGWLSEELGALLFSPVPLHRDKTGALMLWSILARLHQRERQSDMYRKAMAQLAPGKELFLLGRLGPRLCFHGRDEVTGDRLIELRKATEANFTGDRGRDLRGLTGRERRISEKMWSRVFAGWQADQAKQGEPMLHERAEHDAFDPELRLEGEQLSLADMDGQYEATLAEEERARGHDDDEALPLDDADIEEELDDDDRAPLTWLDHEVRGTA